MSSRPACAAVESQYKPTMSRDNRCLLVTVIFRLNTYHIREYLWQIYNNCYPDQKKCATYTA